MKLSDQVCSLEQAKKLKQLGVLQQSIFCFIGDDNPDSEYYEPYELYYTQDAYSQCGASWYENRIPAFTVAELGEMLLHYVVLVNYSLNGKNWRVKHYEHIEEYDTEAQAKADILIFLIEHKKINVDALNEMILED